MTNKNDDGHEQLFYGPYAHIRETLDYGYHTHYKKERQWLQDSIIEKFIESIVTPNTSPFNKSTSSQDSTTDGLCTIPTTPWIIFVTGSNSNRNKDNIIQTLLDTNRLPLVLGFVAVNPDEIATLLPEHSKYIATGSSSTLVNNLNSSSSLRKPRHTRCQSLSASLIYTFQHPLETGYISEIITLAALQAGFNVMVYTNFACLDWYKNCYFAKLKNTHDNLKIAILNVLDDCTTSSTHEFDEINAAIDELKPKADFTCTLRSTMSNHENKECIEIINDKGLTWESFAATWIQECAFRLGKKVLIQNTTNRFSIHDSTIHQFDVTLSTEINYQSNDATAFYGRYAHIRQTLDYEYHRNYVKERQFLQDYIITDILYRIQILDVNGDTCTTPTEPLLVFTAGAMGAGKSYTINTLYKKGRFPLLGFVRIDPDEIRQLFPEYPLYCDHDQLHAGEMTRKEAGYIVEILTMAAIQAGKNVLVDGSLRDWEWYKGYFKRIKNKYPFFKIAILHIVASKEAILERARCRAEVTGRYIPMETLLAAMEQVPRSVNILKNHVDYFCELSNEPDTNDIQILSSEISWDDFSNYWNQTCAWVPKGTKGNVKKQIVSNEMKEY